MHGLQNTARLLLTMHSNMKIVITDYPKVLSRDLQYEKNRITAVLEDAEITVVPYEKRSQWLQQVRDAAALLTAFLPLDGAAMDEMPNLKCIALNASGYDNVDVAEATRRGIAVIPIEEYCTQEVAEHTIALLLALARGLKHYEHEIDREHRWEYASLSGLHRLCGQKLGIAGFGKIGKHMAVDAHAVPFFDEMAFRSMRRQPFFLNVGRGAAVEEEALVHALDMGWIKGVGLDVLASEEPELESNPLVGRENVILTPHSAFYSVESLRALQDISCDNVAYFLKGEYEKVHRIINN